MSTPCVEYPTPEDVQNIRSSIQKKRREVEDYLKQREALDPVEIKREGDRIYSGADEYQVVTDSGEIEGIVAEQKNATDMVSEISSEAKATMPDEEVKEFDTAWKAVHGTIGEGEPVDIAAEALGLSRRSIKIGKHGIDSLWEDDQGNLVVVDGKHTNTKDGTESLHETKFGKQLCDEWLVRKAKQMQDPASALYSEKNALVGRRIERELENVERVIVHTHPATENITLSKGSHGSEDFDQVMVLKRKRP